MPHANAKALSHDAAREADQKQRVRDDDGLYRHTMAGMHGRQDRGGPKKQIVRSEKSADPDRGQRHATIAGAADTNGTQVMADSL